MTKPNNSTVISIRSLLRPSIVEFVGSVHLIPSIGNVTVAAINARAIGCVARPELLHVHLKVGDPHPGLPGGLHILKEPLLAAIPAVPGLLEAPEPGGSVKHVVAVDPDSARLDVLGSLQSQRQLLAVNRGSKAIHRVIRDSNCLLSGPDDGDFKKYDWKLSNSHLNGMATRTGPNISSMTTLEAVLAPVIRVGG